MCLCGEGGGGRGNRGGVEGLSLKFQANVFLLLFRTQVFFSGQLNFYIALNGQDLL